MSRLAEVNQPVLLEVSLYDGNTATRYVQVRIRNSAGTEVSGSPVSLTPAGGAMGFYIGSWTPTAEGEYSARGRVYTDAAFTILDPKYSVSEEVISVRSVDQDLATILTRLGSPAGASISADIAAHRTVTNAMRTDYTTARAGLIDRLDATVSSRSTQTSVDSVKSDTSGLRTDYSSARAGFLDRLDASVSSRATQTSVDTRSSQSSVDAKASQTSLDSVKSDTAGLRADYTTARAGKLDNLDASMSSRQSDSSAVTRHTAVLSRLGTPAAASMSADISAIRSETQSLRTDVTPTRASNLDRLDVVVSSRSTQTSVDTVSSKIGSPAANLSTDLAGVKSDVRSDITAARGDVSSFRQDVTDLIGVPYGDSVSADIAAMHEVGVDTNTKLIGFIHTGTDNALSLPDTFIVPDHGSKTYRLYWRHFTAGIPSDPIAAPTINITGFDGATICLPAPMVKESVGIYFYDYVVTETMSKDIQVVVRVTYTSLPGGPVLHTIRVANQDVTEVTVERIANLLGIPLTGSLASDIYAVYERVAPDVLANAVWNRSRSAHAMAGTFGESAQGVLSPARAVALDRLDVSVSSRASQAEALSNQILTPDRVAKLDLLDAPVSTRATQTSVTAGFASTAKDSTVAKEATVARADHISGLSSTLGIVQSDTRQLRTDLTTARASRLDNLDIALSTRSSQASQDSGFAAAVKPSDVLKSGDIAAALAPVNTSVGSIKADTNTIRGALVTEGVRLHSDERAQISTAVWGHIVIGYSSAGTAGYEIKNQQALLSGPQVAAISTGVWSAAPTSLSDIQQGVSDLGSRFSQERIQKLDRLDVPVSSRSVETSSASRATALSGSLAEVRAAVENAQASLNNLTGRIGVGGTTISADIATVKADAAIIKAKTGSLPSTPASQADLASAVAPVLTAVQGTAAMAAGIKTQTDRIPSDPARESSVQGLPKNPLLESDARLARLDASISSRAVPADFAGIVKSPDLAAVRTDILTVVSQVQGTLGGKASRTDITDAVAPLAKETTAQNIRDAFVAGQANELTAEGVWKYASRSLTVPADSTLSLEGIATSEDVDAGFRQAVQDLTQFEVKVAVTVLPATDQVEIMAWLEEDGEPVKDAAQAAVTAYNSRGELVFTIGPVTEKTSQGVYRLVRANASTVLASNNTYTVSASITRGERSHDSLKTFTVY